MRCLLRLGVKTPVQTVKETGCISLYWGVIVFFLPYRFGGVGERGGMVLLHVNDPPFFTTPNAPVETAYQLSLDVARNRLDTG